MKFDFTQGLLLSFSQPKIELFKVIVILLIYPLLWMCLCVNKKKNWVKTFKIHELEKYFGFLIWRELKVIYFYVHSTMTC